MNFLTLSILLISSLISSISFAQQSINTAGGDISGSGGSVSYSIGQIDYISNSANSGSENQGVQQAYEIFTVSLDEKFVNASISVFPNPTTNQLTIEFLDPHTEHLIFQMVDSDGKTISQGEIISQLTIINTEGLASSTYMIKISKKDNKLIKSFKVVKN